MHPAWLVLQTDTRCATEQHGRRCVLCCTPAPLPASTDTVNWHTIPSLLPVLPQTRAKQYYSGDHRRLRHMPILLHGDGAFAGQGIVYETLDMSQLQDYTVGGTVHLVVNNQVGGGGRCG